MYALVVHDQVKPAVAALPADALPGYFGALDLITADPWSMGRPYLEDNPDGPIRTLAFGPGGFVTYLILERDREVHVIEVFWAG